MKIKYSFVCKAANLLLEINNIKLNQPGIYTIDLTIDNQHQATENICVNHNSLQQQRGLIS